MALAGDEDPPVASTDVEGQLAGAQRRAAVLAALAVLPMRTVR